MSMCILFIRSETNEKKKCFSVVTPFLKKGGRGQKLVIRENPLLIGNYKTLDSERNKLFFTLKGSVFFPQYITHVNMPHKRLIMCMPRILISLNPIYLLKIRPPDFLRNEFLIKKYRL